MSKIKNSIASNTNNNTSSCSNNNNNNNNDHNNNNNSFKKNRNIFHLAQIYIYSVITKVQKQIYTTDMIIIYQAISWISTTSRLVKMIIFSRWLCCRIFRSLTKGFATFLYHKKVSSSNNYNSTKTSTSND